MSKIRCGGRTEFAYGNCNELQLLLRSRRRILEAGASPSSAFCVSLITALLELSGPRRAAAARWQRARGGGEAAYERCGASCDGCSCPDGPEKSESRPSNGVRIGGTLGNSVRHLPTLSSGVCSRLNRQHLGHVCVYVCVCALLCSASARSSSIASGSEYEYGKTESQSQSGCAVNCNRICRRA